MAGLRYKTLRETIVEELRLRIVNQEIVPGSRIVETELAEEFHTSRAPIREALRELENEGLVKYTRNAGCSVRQTTIKDAEEVYLLRVNYETTAVKLMNGKVPETTIKAMEEILTQMTSVDAEHYRQVFENDNEFHAQLIKMVNLPRLYKEWEALKYGNIITSRIKNQNKDAMIERQYFTHKELLDACKEGNCNKICSLIVEHYRRTLRALLAAEGKEESDVYSWSFME